MRRALLAMLLVAGAIIVAAPALADRWHHGGGGHRGWHYGGYGGYRHYGYGHGGYYHHGHGYWGPRAFVGVVPYGWWGPAALGWWGWPGVPVVVREQTIVAEAPVYVERQAASPPDGYWYYCQSAGAYYPDVATCAEPWVPVPPRPE